MRNSVAQLRFPVFVAACAFLCIGTLPRSAACAGEESIKGLPAAGYRLVQEIDCAAENADLLFVEYPTGVSRVETILGVPCRVLPNTEGEAKYFAYRLGEGKGLRAGASYVAVVEYPEDHSRTMYLCNWGCETALGFATGQSLGDVCKGKYVPNNPESLKYPLSGRFEQWTQLFCLHDRFPEIKRSRGAGPRPLTPADGFWFIVAQPAAFQDPLGAGAAVSKIRLYEVTEPDKLTMQLPFPPEGLPRRHVFSREEMADGVVATGHKPEEKDETLRGVKDIASWFEYKMRVMQFLGVDTYGQDLLEFGHNQGWDSAEGGGSAWVNQSPNPGLWEEVLNRAAQHKLTVLPYYEYRGSIGGDKNLSLGVQHRARRLDGGETYTHISWCEGNNVDITDPDTLADAKKVLDLTLVKYRDKVSFLGAWFRQRPTAMPISFNDKNLAAFSKEANQGKRITRSHLQNDKGLLERYYQWWFTKRRQFFDALSAYLREKVGPEAIVIYTNDTSEPGRPLPRTITGEGKKDGWQWMQVVVNDDFPVWEKILADESHYQWMKSYDFREVVDRDMHLRGLQTFTENWDKWEMNHASPPDDPQNYADSTGAMLSYSYNRLYTVSSPKPFDAYRSKAGLTIMRHYTLNENEMSVGDDEILGYFVCDVERAGPYSMMAEARAVAYGDPYYLGSLTGNSNKRGFPQYVRRFHAAFLALPALPSTVVNDASSDPEVVVRTIPTPGQGTYVAVVNTGFGGKSQLSVKLPAGTVRDAVSGEVLTVKDNGVTLDLDPAELRTLHIQ
jgi:hypothetical protein